MIDTHCHLTSTDLCDRVDDVLSEAAAAGVDRVISVSTTPDDGRAAIGLAQRYEGVFATVGLHPHEVEQWTDRSALLDALRALAGHPKVLALGEMGLDRHYSDPPIESQRCGLGWQLELAAELPSLPIVIHNREATDEVLGMILGSGLPAERFVFHCFTGSAAEAHSILDAGAMVSFTGIVTFKSAAELAEASDLVPLDRLMVETDSPYLTPEPHRKVRPNEPRYVPDVARFLAARRGMSFEDFTARMDTNAEHFFGLPESVY